MSRPYVGEMMLTNPLRTSDFLHTCAVIVSGDPGNPCGHALLHVGDFWYFHVAGRNDVPKHMHEAGYRRYLKENSKREIRRWIVQIPNPEAAHQKLLEVVSKRWPWYVLYNNCVSFVEVILEAGGSKAGMYLNCPTLERFA